MRQSFPEHREASVHGSTYIPVSHQESSKIPALSIPEQPLDVRWKEERIGEERWPGRAGGRTRPSLTMCPLRKKNIAGHGGARL